MEQPRANPSGWLIVDKPVGPTSRAVVNQLLRLAPRTRMGHAGTLDPLASGVLVVALGAATRYIELVQEMPKSYRTRVRLGARSDTDDAQGQIEPHPAPAHPTSDAIEAALQRFIGAIAQVPPRYSAIQRDGRRAYDLARQGAPLELPARTVRIDAIRIIAYAWPFLDLEVDCGGGTYIRALVRDLGEALGCGGLVETLQRTRIGHFTLEHAATPDQILQSGLTTVLLPLEFALNSIPRLELDADAARRVQHGQRIQAAGQGRPAGRYALHAPSGLFLGLGRLDDQAVLHPDRMLPAQELHPDHKA